MRQGSRACITIAIAMLTFAAASRAADDNFVPPKDGKLSEDQVVNYIGVLKDQMNAIKSADQAGQGTSGAASYAIASHMSQQISQAVAAHHLTDKEYNWIADRVGPVWPAAVQVYNWDQSGKGDLEKQIKAKQADLDAAKAKLAQYQKAQASGTRVLTPDQLAAATQPATSDRDQAQSDINDRENDIKAINADIAQHQKDADDANKLATTPPADVGPDDRQSYIDGKKADAQTALDALKDSQSKLADAQKALDDANARLAVANGKIAHPEVPVTDDEKAQVKQDNQQGITDAQTTIDNDTAAIKTLQDTLAAGPPGVDQLSATDKQNLPVVQKHLKELMDAMGAGAVLKPQ